MQGFHSLASTT